MKISLRWLAFVLIAAAVFAPAAAAFAQTPQEIIAAIDKVRNPGKPFRVLDTLVEYRDGKPQRKIVLKVYAKEDPETGQFRNVARYVFPPRDAGKTLLMNGSIMWFYDPTSSATVRISPQERLIGQASNGDVLTTNLSKDYTAVSAVEDTIKDVQHALRRCWRVDLKAANDRAIYARIEYWADKATYHPVKGKFYADSGRLLKIVYYGKYEPQLGGMRPSQAVILDELDSSLVTTMNFTDYQSIEIPESWFQREYLPRLKTE